MGKKVWILFFSCVMLLLAACGTSVQAPAEQPSEVSSQPAEASPEAVDAKDGQNPVMNIVGKYNAGDSIEALVEAEGANGARITVTYAGSPWFRSQTVMSGVFDAETLTVVFSNATLTEYTYNSQGGVAEETVSYSDGKGRALFHPEDNTLTIIDEFPSGDLETVYSWGPAADMKSVTDPNHYTGVTAMDKFKVETEIGFAVRTAYLDENWYALADMIRYPITINETVLADADAFLDYMKDKTVHESDRQAMMDEDFLDMFVNGEGICMGSGQVWLNDPNYMTDEEPQLQIIAISGIVDR